MVFFQGRPRWKARLSYNQALHLWSGFSEAKPPTALLKMSLTRRIKWSYDNVPHPNKQQSLLYAVQAYSLYVGTQNIRQLGRISSFDPFSIYPST
jgi:hypothetical protein